MATQLRVRDIMTPDPSTVLPDDLLYVAARDIIEKRYSGIPVVNAGGELVGLVEVEDLLPRPSQVPFTKVPVLDFQGEWVDETDLREYSRALRETTVEKVMRKDLPTVPDDLPIGEALAQLVTEAYRRLLVVDEDGVLVGVVTRTDLLRILSGGS